MPICPDCRRPEDVRTYERKSGPRKGETFRLRLCCTRTPGGYIDRRREKAQSG